MEGRRAAQRGDRIDEALFHHGCRKQSRRSEGIGSMKRYSIMAAESKVVPGLVVTRSWLLNGGTSTRGKKWSEAWPDETRLNSPLPASTG